MRRIALASLLTLVTFTGLVAVVLGGVSVRTDLSFFLPSERPVEVQALTEGFDRAGSRIMVRLAGAEPETLAQASDALAVRLRARDDVVMVQNGRLSLPDSIRDYVIARRFLLGPELPEEPFSRERLAQALERGVAQLSTTTGWALRDLFPRDPTQRLRTTLESFAPGAESGPARRAGVWMDGEDRALLLVHLAAPSGDLPAQRIALDALAAGVESAGAETGASALSWAASGPGLFALEASENIRDEMTRSTAIAGGAVALIILLLYRAPLMLVLVGLPAATGLLVGMLAVQTIFGHVHGVAIAFGAVLSGVAADYPIHLASLSRPGDSGYQTARRIRTPMLLGGLTTIVGLAALIPSSFPGLAQIGVLASVGVAVALAVSQLALPAITPAALKLPAPRLAGRVLEATGARPRARLLTLSAYGAMIVVLGVLAWRSDAPVWERDLRALSVSAPERRALDGELREAFNLPDVRRLLLVEGADEQEVLARQYALLPALEAARAEGEIAGFWAAAHLLPPIERQRRRQEAMLAPEAMRQRLESAAEGLPLGAQTFEPFVEDVALQRATAPIEPAVLKASPLAPFFLAPWPIAQGGFAGSVTLADPKPEALSNLPHGRLIDLAAVASTVVVDYRNEALALLAAGLGVGLILLSLFLRCACAVLRTAAPPLLAIALTTTALLAGGMSLTLFHLLALLLVASLGVDYSLFFTGYSRTSEASVREFRSVSVCCATSSIVFATLAFSTIPVLSAIGATVAVGAPLSFLITIFLFGRRSE